MTDSPSRRDFLKGAGAAAAVGTLPLSMVKLAFADPSQDFTFAYISDSHIQHIPATSSCATGTAASSGRWRRRISSARSPIS